MSFRFWCGSLRVLGVITAISAGSAASAEEKARFMFDIVPHQSDRGCHLSVVVFSFLPDRHISDLEGAMSVALKNGTTREIGFRFRDVWPHESAIARPVETLPGAKCGDVKGATVKSIGKCLLDGIANEGCINYVTGSPSSPVPVSR